MVYETISKVLNLFYSSKFNLFIYILEASLISTNLFREGYREDKFQVLCQSTVLKHHVLAYIPENGHFEKKMDTFKRGTGLLDGKLALLSVNKTFGLEKGILSGEEDFLSGNRLF